VGQAEGLQRQHLWGQQFKWLTWEGVILLHPMLGLRETFTYLLCGRLPLSGVYLALVQACSLHLSLHCSTDWLECLSS
jgi:hypothetical protein